ILAETFRSLNACRKTGEGRFIGCAQLLLVWFHSHFWKVEKVSYRDDDIEWRAPWLIPNEILYRCGDFDWVPLLGIWGAIGYAPLLVSRQYRSRQFIPAMQGLAYCDFSHREDNYKKRVREISNAWNQTHRMKILAVGPTITSEYNQWRDQRVNDNILASNPKNARSLEEHLQVLPSEIEIIKQEFEKRSLELGKKIEQLEEEKMQLGLDVDIQRLEADKLRKGKNKAEEDLDSLKTDYKKLRRSVRTAGLGKSPEQWRQEIQEEKMKANQWEKKFQDTRAREVTLGKSLLVCQNEKTELKARVTELERLLHQYRSRSSAVELKTSLDKIEELKGQVRELEAALQNSEFRMELLERSSDQWQGQLQRSQDQIRDRDYIMGEAVAQVREVADHLQTLAVQADLLSLKYELESDRDRELAWLLKKVKALGIR
ncbi:hypothetical protein Goklo_029208, partial [Gossypium klotzschianum]|nr:hypothetical protein [Gossypium klotzschianum]